MISSICRKLSFSILQSRKIQISGNHFLGRGFIFQSIFRWEGYPTESIYFNWSGEFKKYSWSWEEGGTLPCPLSRRYPCGDHSVPVKYTVYLPVRLKKSGHDTVYLHFIFHKVQLKFPNS